MSSYNNKQRKKKVQELESQANKHSEKKERSRSQSVQRGIQKILLNENDSRSSSTTNPSKTKASSQASTAPKQMTWASIASQPAKPTLRASSTSSILKKKGPGMPPPPMVPGKHNMDIGTWESPKSGPALVPPPPPPVVPVPIMEPFPLSQSKSNSGPSNNGPSTSSAHSGTNSITHIQTGHSANQQTQYQNQNLSGPPNIQNNPYNRPPWVSQNTNRPNNSSGTREVSQNQRSYIQKGMGQGMASSGNSSYHGQSQNQSEKVIQHEAPITQPPPAPSPILSNSSSNHPVLDELRDKNNYNPPEFDFDKAALARFFVIKSFAEDDIHRSIKYEIWCSTDHGNKRLDQAYRERESVGGIVYLFFSVNSSGHFCGMAQMISPVDYDSVSNVWSQNKWKGMFKVKWIYVKDVPNMSLRHIYLENNEDKPVTNSRDTQEVLSAKGLQVLKIFHTFERTTCIFEDFIHYEQIQEKERSKKNDNELPGPRNSSPGEPRRGGSDYERGYEKPGYHGGGGGGGYRDKTYGRGGGYHNFENRRHDDHRGGGGGYDRPHRDGGHDGHSSFTGYNRENNTDFHNTRGYHRGEYSRRDDRGHSGYNNSDRDRDNYNDGNNGAFMSRGDGQRGGAFRLNYNRSVQRGIQKILLDENDSRSSSTTNPSKTKASSQASTAPKQMTWASIASQPAKPTLRASSTSSILKRKGPGMAPPPMVPGKHNMDIGTWESPKSGPALVPPPPPPVVPVPIMEPFPLSQSKSNSGPSNNGPSTSSAHSGTNSTTHFQTGHSANQQTQYQNQNLSGPPNIQNNPYNRPLWVSQNTNRPNNSSGTREVSQNQRSYIQKGMGQGMALSGNSSYHGQSQNQSEKVIQHEAPITQPPPAPSPILSNSSSNHPVLDELRDKNNYNPPEFDFDKAALARFFVIKSFAEDDIHRSIKYEIWCSTDHGNKRLDQAYRERESVGGIVYLFFSVNSSGHFCGMAQMISPVDYDSVSNVWSQNKWNGMFKVKWIYVKDVPNMCLRHIYLENNEDKPVTYSRDTQEVLSAKGLQVLKIFHTFERTTCIFEDFIHYEQIQEKERSKKNDNELPGPRNSSPGEPRRGGSDYERGYEKPGYHGGGGGGGYRDKTYGRGGGYHNFENRRHDDHRGGGGGYDHPHRDGGHDGHSSFTGYNRENNTDFHNARGYHRGEYSRRDDRGHSGFNNRDRDRDNYNDGNNGAFMSRGDGQRGGSI